MAASRDADGQRGGLAEDAESAATVRRIFAMAATRPRLTLQAIADALNADKVPTRRGGKWWPGTVRYVLDNPKYKGRVEYLFRAVGKEAHIVREGNHPAIL